MEIVASIGLGVLLLVLMLLAAMQPRRADISSFELERLEQSGSKTLTVRRERNFANVLTIKWLLMMLFAIGIVALAVHRFSGYGYALALIGIVAVVSLSRWKFIQREMRRFYARYEKPFLKMIDNYQRLIWLFRPSLPPLSRQDEAIRSRDELLHMITTADGVLSSREKHTLKGSLSIDTGSVSDIMTPRSVVETIGVDELLGPLVLDDLHKTGYTRFPVVEGEDERIVGVLHIQDLLQLEQKKSTTVRQAMDPRVQYVRDDYSLRDCLIALIKSHTSLMVVVNRYKEIVGVVTLEDALEALLGEPVVDKFDKHDSLPSVAARNTRGSNLSVRRHDV